MSHIARCARLALIAAAALIPMFAAAQEPPRGATRVAPGGTTRVYVMAAFDKDCRGLPAPPITIVTPPSKGQVSLREGQTVVLQQSLSGNCLGQRVSGTGIYYTAHANSSGPDSFSITAKLSTGEVASRTFQLNVQD